MKISNENENESNEMAQWRINRKRKLNKCQQ
jgi:hypothetical protein